MRAPAARAPFSPNARSFARSATCRMVGLPCGQFQGALSVARFRSSPRARRASSAAPIMMLERHARYMPVMDQGDLQGVISFYDVAKSVVDSQNFENKMLKAYIRDWPEGEEPKDAD